jgi:hypothetical protein
MFGPLFAICAVGFALLPATACAEPPVYPDQHPAAAPQFRAMIAAGVEFWAKRGVTITGPVDLWTASDVGNAQDGLGETPFEGQVYARSIRAADYGVNRIVLRSSWMRYTLRQMRDPDIGDLYAAQACAMLWHELGHIGGLALPRLVDGQWVDGHPATGLMSQSLEVPGDCRVLGHRLTRRAAVASRVAARQHHRNIASWSRRQRRTHRRSSRHGRSSAPDGSRPCRRAGRYCRAQAGRSGREAGR